MQFTTTFFTLAASALAVVAPAMAAPSPAPDNGVLNYDTRFDDPKGSLSTTMCPDIKGHTTFGSIPTFPYIAGAYFVTEFNSARCGACYELSSTHADGTVVTKTFTIINNAPRGFISSLTGAENLTGLKRSEFPGDAPITAKEVPASHCGL